MRAKIEIGSTEESMQKALKVLQVVFTIIDKVVRLKLSDAARTKCERNRKKTPNAKAKEQSDRQEEEQLEKLRKEQEDEKEKVRKMTPEQRKKYEEKKRKQEMQAQKKRMTKMVKH
mmetsp:Transcript_47511/g.62845  ORF Transcript_47511/g.62845 Transcript_47511/m.62845 type:complete len:116 (+) Transcript_47511:868-1215(+)